MTLAGGVSPSGALVVVIVAVRAVDAPLVLWKSTNVLPSLDITCPLVASPTSGVIVVARPGDDVDGDSYSWHALLSLVFCGPAAGFLASVPLRSVEQHVDPHCHAEQDQVDRGFHDIPPSP